MILRVVMFIAAFFVGLALLASLPAHAQSLQPCQPTSHRSCGQNRTSDYPRCTTAAQDNCTTSDGALRRGGADNHPPEYYNPEPQQGPRDRRPGRPGPNGFRVFP